MLKRKINTKFLLASLKTLNNSKDYYESQIFLFRLDLIGWISQVYVHTWPAFGTTYRVTGGYRYRPEQAKTFFSIFFTKWQLKVVKTISAHSKGTDSVLRTLKKYSSCCTNPLWNHKSNLKKVYGTDNEIDRHQKSVSIVLRY